MAHSESKHGHVKFWKSTLSPDVCGTLYGLLQIPCFLLMRTYFGVSAAFVTAVCHACSLIDKDLFSKNKYAANFRSGSVVIFELFIHFGSFIGARYAP